MNLYKNKGLIYSQGILELLLNYIDDGDITASVESFYNCREQGYMVRVDNDKDKKMYLWFYAHRNSDEPTITWKYNSHPLSNNMYDKASWEERTKSFSNIVDASDYARKLIAEYFNEETE